MFKVLYFVMVLASFTATVTLFKPTWFDLFALGIMVLIGCLFKFKTKEPIQIAEVKIK